MGWNERSDPDMRTANFKFSCDVYREGVYMVINSRIRGSFVILVLFVSFSPFYTNTKWQTYLKHHHQS